MKKRALWHALSVMMKKRAFWHALSAIFATASILGLIFALCFFLSDTKAAQSLTFKIHFSGAICLSAVAAIYCRYRFVRLRGKMIPIRMV